VKNTNFVGDINGACADSIKHSIVTNRTTNPLQPVYSGLDCGDLLLPLIPPLIPQDLVKFPTFRKLSQERNGPGMLVCVSVCFSFSSLLILFRHWLEVIAKEGGRICSNSGKESTSRKANRNRSG
jgi:hypothetical protein